MKTGARAESIDYKKKFSLDGKVVIITGGSGLIGRAFVEAAIQFGTIPVIVDVDQKQLNDFASALNDKGDHGFLALHADITQKKAVEGVLSETLAHFKKVDGLVNCHQYKGGCFFARFEDYSVEDWDAILASNLKGTFLTCQVIGSWMAAQGGGSIINMPSVYSLVAPNQNLYKDTAMGCPAAYSASKGGVEALSKYLAAYWGSKGVRVNMITPHGVWNNHEKQFEANFAHFLPLGRMSSNHEVAGALVYLLSDASSFVTGHNLVVDGGWTTW